MNIIPFTKADKAYIQYCNFIDDDMLLILENAKLFVRGESRIDDFFFQDLKVYKKYPDMSTLLILILTLSHGQAEVERGFNNNNLVLKDNMSIDSIVARRFMNDYMIQKGLHPHEMPITPQLMKSVSSARTRYNVYLEEAKKEKAKSEIDAKMKEKITELQSVKENIQCLQDLIKEFDIKFVNLAKKAEEKNDIKFLIEGNALKRKSDEKSDQLEILKKRKEELVSEIKEYC